MSVYGVTNAQTTSYPSTSRTSTKQDNKKSSETTSNKEDSGVVYEPSNLTGGKDANTVKDYSSIVKKMKSELKSKNQQLQNLVNQLLNKQANKYTSLADLFKNADEIVDMLKACADSIEVLDYQMQDIRNKIDQSKE